MNEPDIIIAYNPRLARLGGTDGKPVGMAVGVLLSQAVYHARNADAEGWFCWSAQDIQAETEMTRTESETARRRARDAGYIEEDRHAVDGKLRFRLTERFSECRKPANRNAENLQTEAVGMQETYIPQPAGMQETRKPECRKPANRNAENLQTEAVGMQETYIPQPAGMQETRKPECRKPANRNAGFPHSLPYRENQERIGLEEREAQAPVSAPDPPNRKLKQTFVPPTCEEMRDYMATLGDGAEALAGECWDYYASKGWRVGTSPMRDWQAAARGWKAKSRQFERAGPARGSPEQRGGAMVGRRATEPKSLQDLADENEERLKRVGLWDDTG